MKTFLISDTHFSHKNILSFLRKDGTRLREFESVTEMDNYMVERWNSVVSTQDKVYHLGDVCFRNRDLEIISRLNGRKVLIKGNHDNLKPNKYLEYFYDIRAYHVLDKLILAHVPLHPESLSRWRGQIHGHTHANNLFDKKYFNVSVENIEYTPVDFEYIREYFKNDLS